MAYELSTETAQVSEYTQFIVVNIGKEQYGLDIKYIDNIVRMQSITRVPKVAPYLKGVINLRGEVVPHTYSGKNVWDGFEGIEF